MISIVIPSLEGYDELNTKTVQAYQETAPEGAELQFCISAEDQAFAKNVNTGLKRAEGEIIIISNNDVTPLPGWYEWATNERPPNLFAFTPRPDCGWCFGMSREVLENVGYLDENLINSFEDYDYFIRAALVGYVRMLAPKHYMIHEGGHTLNKVWGNIRQAKPERMEQCNRNIDYMRKKWPGINPAAVPLMPWAIHCLEIMRGWKAEHVVKS